MIVKNGEAEVAYAVRGKGGLPLLLLHGWGASGTGRFWNALVTELDQEATVILPDVRGHGDSSVSADVDAALLADDASAVLDACGLASAVVVGHSLGSRVALRLAAFAPNRVTGLVLLAPVPPIPLPLPDDMLASWLKATGSRESWVDLLKQFTKEPLPADRADDYFADVTRATRTGLQAAFRMCQRSDWPDGTPPVRVPTLLVPGEHDHGFAWSVVGPVFSAICSDASVVPLDAGHHIPLEQPRSAASLIRTFAGSVSGLAQM